MDGSAFDQMSRRIASFGTRRRALKAIAGTVIAAVAGSRATAGAQSCTAQYRPCQSDGQCCAGAVCQSGLCQPGCRIDGVFRSASTPQPGNTCARCTPAVSTTEWSAANEGMACWSGTTSLCGSGPSTCQSGVCAAASSITCQPLTVCHEPGTCNPNTGLCSNPPAPAGKHCGSQDMCFGGFHTPALTCDGNGLCVGGQTVPCAPYVCGSDRCLTSCTGDSQCSPGNVCRNSICRPPCGDISGTITDALTGEALAGATITTGDRTTTTDGGGNYALICVPVGSRQVTASFPDYHNGTKTVSVIGDETATVDLALEPRCGSITGRITDQLTGNGIGGATVSAGGTSVTTNGAGNYAISCLPPGPYTVSASGANHASGSTNATVPINGTVVADLALEPLCGHISGTITDSLTQSGIANATVTAGGKTVTTNSAGSYTISCLPPVTAPYTVEASAANYDTGSTSATVPANGTATANLALEPQFGHIAGTITDSLTGSAISGATVTTGSRTTTTNESGEYGFDDLTPGEHTVSATADNYHPGSTAVTVQSNLTASGDFTLNRMCGTVQGQIHVLGINPPVGISGATVEIDGKTATTGTNGNYSILCVAPGAQTLSASAAGYWSNSRSVTVGTSGSVNAPLALETQICGALDGFVSDAESDDPISGATITVDDQQTTTNEFGLYSFDCVRTGQRTVIASAEGYDTLTTTALIEEGETSSANFALPPVGGADIRIVLEWGAAPLDLDLHFSGPAAVGSENRFHAWSATQNPVAHASMSDDAAEGFGPETGTIRRVSGSFVAGEYRFWVYHFPREEEEGTGASFASSGATVTLFRGDFQIAQYQVSAASGSQSLRTWRVFDLDLTADGEITQTPVQTMVSGGNHTTIY